MAARDINKIEDKDESVATPKKDSSEDTIRQLFAVTSIGFLSYGFLSPFYQLYHWLRYAAWLDLSVIEILKEAKWSWAQDPSEWLGLHKILTYVPSAVVAIPLGFIFLLLTEKAIEVAKKL